MTRGICMICKNSIELLPNPEPPEEIMDKFLEFEKYICDDHGVGAVRCPGSLVIPKCFEQDFQSAKDVIAMIEAMG